MRDLKITFGGYPGTKLEQDIVEDKNYTIQRALINLTTVSGSDPIFSERGTDALASCISGLVIDRNSAIHICNFAALDTISFLSSETELGDAALSNIDFYDMSYVNDTNTLSTRVVISFSDGTTTETTTTL